MDGLIIVLGEVAGGRCIGERTGVEVDDFLHVSWLEGNGTLKTGELSKKTHVNICFGS